MKENDSQMSMAERSAASILVIETDAQDRTNLKTALKQVAFGNITDAPNHLAGLEKFNDRKFTHVIFDAKKTNYPMRDWLSKVFELCPNIIAIPASGSPSVDDVFDLLVIGAKGYLVKPFTFDTVDQAVVMATKGEPISEAVLKARDRNDALVAIMMSSLDKFSTIYRQSQQFETAKRELPRAMAILKRAADLAHTFAKGGEDGLLEALERFCIERSKGPASKLGRLRKRLTNTRSTESASAD
jgi:DNA-binding NarL/FixJ family response regulator